MRLKKNHDYTLTLPKGEKRRVTYVCRRRALFHLVIDRQHPTAYRVVHRTWLSELEKEPSK